MTSAHLEELQVGRVLRITLNRPEKRNALNLALCEDLVHALDSADADRGVGAIVVNANGPAFCAGMDLKEAADVDQAHLAQIHERLFTTIDRIRTPVIAAVHGAALAGGTGLAANAHIVFATPDARFGLTEIRIGLWPVLIFRAVAHAMGERRALELSITGREIKASEAMSFGLVSEVVEAPLAKAMEVAEAVAGFSPVALSTGLDYVREIRGLDWAEAGRIGRETRDRLMANADFKEGSRAFLEKKKAPAGNTGSSP